MKSDQYTNYGDVNPLDYGGIWVKYLGNNEYDIIQNTPDEEKENNQSVYDLTVNITDSWIERKLIMSYIGMTEENFDPLEYAIGCINYYAPENFGSSYNMSTEELIDFLKARNIEV